MSRPVPPLRCRNSSRIRRFARFRRTAPPSFRVAMIPSRFRSSPLGRANSVRWRPRTRVPRCCTARNSGRRRMRSPRVSVRSTFPCGPATPLPGVTLTARPEPDAADALQAYDTDRRSRPFARRCFRIRRPLRVLIRFRKPCVRFRRRLFGWKVRFIVPDLQEPPGRRSRPPRSPRETRNKDRSRGRAAVSTTTGPSTPVVWGEHVPRLCDGCAWGRTTTGPSTPVVWGERRPVPVPRSFGGERRPGPVPRSFGASTYPIAMARRGECRVTEPRALGRTSTYPIAMARLGRARTPLRWLAGLLMRSRGRLGRARTPLRWLAGGE